MSTSRGSQSNPAFIGMWNPEAAQNVKNALSINREPIDYTKDQMIQLYLMLYPFIAADFSHRDDLFNWAKKQLEQQTEKVDELNEKLATLKSELDSHAHIGNMGSPTSPASAVQPISQVSTEPWATQPEDQDFKYGESLVTDSSTYSSNITHRKPQEDSVNISRNNTEPIAVSYNEQLKMIPFDVGGDQIKEEDEFANQSTI